MDLYNMRKEISSGKSIYDLPLKVTYYEYQAKKMNN